jgi:hypothetical protein
MENEEIGRVIDELTIDLKKAIKKAEEREMPKEMILLQLITVYGMLYNRNLVDLLIKAGEVVNYNLDLLLKIVLEEATRKWKGEKVIH